MEDVGPFNLRIPWVFRKLLQLVRRDLGNHCQSFSPLALDVECEVVLHEAEVKDKRGGYLVESEESPLRWRLVLGNVLDIFESFSIEDLLLL